MAIKAYRDYAKAKKGITAPELVAPVTVHSAFDKACYYFGVKLVHVPVGADYKADLNAVRNAINKNTIAVCFSFLSFFSLFVFFSLVSFSLFLFLLVLFFSLLF